MKGKTVMGLTRMDHNDGYFVARFNDRNEFRGFFRVVIVSNHVVQICYLYMSKLLTFTYCEVDGLNYFKSCCLVLLLNMSSC